MNELSKIQNHAMARFAEEKPHIAARGIDESTWSALCSSVYPGAREDSVLMAVDYCRARQLDPLLKPVHLVPMNVKNAQTGEYGWRDVPMPGVGLYRIQADRSGTYAGADAPEFGATKTESLTDKNGNAVSVSFPEWCRYTVHKKIGDRIVAFTATEYWVENYATDSGRSSAPNSMWKKRPFAQLAKCAEAQALRKGWPEIGQEPTAEEMEGKEYHVKDVTPAERDITPRQDAPALISHEQEQQILDALKEANLTEEWFCKAARKGSIAELEAVRFSGALSTIAQKQVCQEERENENLHQ